MFESETHSISIKPTILSKKIVISESELVTNSQRNSDHYASNKEYVAWEICI